MESNLADITAKIFLVMNASYSIEGRRYSIIFMLHSLHVRHSIPCIGVFTYKGKLGKCEKEVKKSGFLRVKNGSEIRAGCILASVLAIFHLLSYKENVYAMKV